MSKWECEVCGEKCVLDMVDEQEGFRPVCCPVDNTSGIKPDWHPVDETVTKCSQLPKLTAEVFDRPDCPKWAQWAAVDGSGYAYYYSERPFILSDEFGWGVVCGANTQSELIPGKFTHINWSESRIERPAKLPEWCKPGAWLWLKSAESYEQIEEIEGRNIICETIFFDVGAIGKTAFEARLRPWKGSESLNKVVITGGDIFGVVIGCTWSTANVSGQWINCKKLLNDDYKQPDGSPCGFLEHLENGEWVK